METASDQEVFSSVYVGEVWLAAEFIPRGPSFMKMKTPLNSYRIGLSRPLSSWRRSVETYGPGPFVSIGEGNPMDRNFHAKIPTEIEKRLSLREVEGRKTIEPIHLGCFESSPGKKKKKKFRAASIFFLCQMGRSFHMTDFRRG